jgi:hypothetical protein
MVGDQVESRDGGSSSTKMVIRPGGHVRAGLSFLSLDLGILDRQTFSGYPNAHIGFSGAIGRDGHRIRHPDDTLLRLFLGGISLPGADASLTHYMKGIGLEVFITPRLVLGVQAATSSEGNLFGASLRSQVGK